MSGGRRTFRQAKVSTRLKPSRPARRAREDQRRASTSTRPKAVAVGNRLRELLREYRRDRSRADGLPAYVIFTDATLRALAREKPTTKDALRNIHGIGEKKLEDLGKVVMEVIHTPAESRPEE